MASAGSVQGGGQAAGQGLDQLDTVGTLADRDTRDEANGFSAADGVGGSRRRGDRADCGDHSGRENGSEQLRAARSAARIVIGSDRVITAPGRQSSHGWGLPQVPSLCRDVPAAGGPGRREACSAREKKRTRRGQGKPMDQAEIPAALRSAGQLALPPDVAARVGVPRPAVGAVTGPAPFVPDAVPVTNPAPPPMTIPFGAPGCVAAAIATKVLPTGAAVAERLERLERDLGQAVEHALVDPLHPTQGLQRFSRRAAQIIREREQRAGSIGDVAALTTAVVRSITRWRDGDALARERQARILAARRELAEVERTLQGLIAFPPWTHDALARERLLRERMTEQIGRKQAAEARIARLDPGGDAARAKEMGAAVKAAGGVKALATTLAGLMPDTQDPQPLAELTRDRKRVEARLAGLDPESERAGYWRGERGRVVDQVAAIHRERLALRQFTAAGWLERSLAGDIEAVEWIAGYAGRVGEPFAAAVRGARGTDAQLVATVADMIGGQKQ
jgi:hypothetical protein